MPVNRFFESRILSLLPHDFHNHPLVPLPIKFGIKNPLPRPQIEFAPGYGHYDFMMYEQRFEMRVAVVFTRVMMFVVFAKRRQMFQPLVMSSINSLSLS